MSDETTGGVEEDEEVCESCVYAGVISVLTAICDEVGDDSQKSRCNTLFEEVKQDKISYDDYVSGVRDSLKDNDNGLKRVDEFLEDAKDIFGNVLGDSDGNDGKGTDS